jgi:hypothetical protein
MNSPISSDPRPMGSARVIAAKKPADALKKLRIAGFRCDGSSRSQRSTGTYLVFTLWFCSMVSVNSFFASICHVF